MNLWKQRRLFTCSRCGERYTHDKAHAHNLFRCVLRSTKEQLLVQGRVYEPKAGR